MEYEMMKLAPEDYTKCGGIWDMTREPEQAERWYDELVSGNRIIWVCTVGGAFIGEGSLVIENNDPDYTMPGRRICFSRLIVKKEYRNQGVGGALIDYITDQARQMGYREVSIGVNKDNAAALALYRKKGFTKVLFDGQDELGPYYKLLKVLDWEITYTNSITVEEYNNLREAVGWGGCVPERVQTALARSDYLIVARDGLRAVGMARVMHDGVQALVMDVTVHPDYQGLGIGKTMMRSVMAFLEALSSGGGIFVNLMSALGKDGFYEKFGFDRRPNETRGPGMTQWISKKANT